MDIRKEIDSWYRDDITYKDVYLKDLYETIRELDLMDSTLIGHYADSRTGEISHHNRYYYDLERMKLLQVKLDAWRDLYQLYKDAE